MEGERIKEFDNEERESVLSYEEELRSDGFGDYQIPDLVRKRKEELSKDKIEILRKNFRKHIPEQFKFKVLDAPNLKTKPQKIGIGLIAAPGSGKTTFINALNYISIDHPNQYVPLARAPAGKHVTKFVRQVKILGGTFYFHDMVGVNDELETTLDYMKQMTVSKLRKDQTQQYSNVVLEPVDISAFIFMVSANPEKDGKEVKEHSSWSEFFKFFDEFTAFDKHRGIYRPYVVVMTHARSSSAKHLKALLEERVPENSLWFMDNRFEGGEGLTEPLALDLTLVMEKLINAIANDLVVTPVALQIAERIYYEARDVARSVSKSTQGSLTLILLAAVIALIALVIGLLFRVLG